MLYLHRIFNGIWLIDSDFAVNYLPMVAAYIKGNATPLIASSTDNNPINVNNGIQVASLNNGMYQLSGYGDYRSPEDAPEGSVAVLVISGAITKHDQQCGPSGIQTKSNLMNRCFANDNIKGIVVKIESGGGEGMAMRLMNEVISKKNKPVVAFIDDNACSAAYGIASGCDTIVANSAMSRIGSIGTYLSVADYTKYFEKQGINIIEVYASDSTEKNKEYYEALKGNLEPLREIANKYNEMFMSMVENNRSGKLTAGRDVWGTGKVFFGDYAKEIGLIDDIDSFDNILNYFNYL